MRERSQPLLRKRQRSRTFCNTRLDREGPRKSRLYFWHILLCQRRSVFAFPWSIFKEKITESSSLEADSLSLAARITAASEIEIDIVDGRGFDTPLSMQSEDGFWKDGRFYKYGASELLTPND